MEIILRKSIQQDLEIFFLNQTDTEANRMAAFTPKDPFDKEAYMTKWLKLLDDETINMQTILIKEKVVGCVVKFIMAGNAEVTYAISKQYWGKGITTKALVQFLKTEKTRPIYGRVAFDNFGSQKVLERAGFVKIEESAWFANARGKEIVEFIYRLD